jgi:hypothetical protein
LVINEFAQWSVLIVLAIFVLGLTRQLGTYLVPARDVRAREVGPSLGATLPSRFFLPDERASLDALMRGRRTDWVLLLVVSESCPQCGALLERMLARAGATAKLPIVALSRGSSVEHRGQLERVADLVVVDSDRLDAAELTVAPFALIVDRDLRVHQKQFVWDIDELLDVWNATYDGNGVRARAAAPAALPGVVQVNGD